MTVQTQRRAYPTTPEDAAQQIDQWRARVTLAGQRYLEARAALEQARDDLKIVELTVLGEFSADPPVDFEVGYYSVRPIREHACGSRGEWSWQA